MKYRVVVVVGECLGTLTVVVDADSPEDAKAEAEEFVRSQPVEAVQVQEV